MKKTTLLVVIMLAALIINAQKSIIDDLLEQSPDAKKKTTTCVNVASEMLSAFYEGSSMEVPQRYQSISICESPSMMNDIRLLPTFKDYEKLMCVAKDDDRNICYYQKKTEKKGKKEQELLICMQHHNDFSAIYLKGENISIQYLGTHLDLIQSYLQQNKFAK